MLPYNYNRKLGYYQLGNDEYEYAIEAIMASRGDQHVKFKFNNDFFSQVDWTVEPSETLSELYAQRARQLRERYDHLVLSYSGGSDSWTILNTFLTNGIKLDEITSYGPREATKSFRIDPTNFDYENAWQEYKLVLEKDLQYLTTHHPDIKISFSDWSQNTNNIEFKDGWQHTQSTILAGNPSNKFYAPNLTDSIDRFKNIGWVLGIEKPRVCYRDGRYYMFFLDYVSHYVNDNESQRGHFWTPEFFYWAPESERILRKQAHTIKRFYQQNPQLLPYISWPPSNPKYGQLYESIVKPLIYPNWDLTKYQANKPMGNEYYMGWDTVLWHHNPNLREHWIGGVKEALNAVDKKYINSNYKISGFVSDFYEI